MALSVEQSSERSIVGEKRKQSPEQTKKAKDQRRSVEVNETAHALSSTRKC
jgi:hypothetical protein